MRIQLPLFPTSTTATEVEVGGGGAGAGRQSGDRNLHGFWGSRAGIGRNE